MSGPGRPHVASFWACFSPLDLCFKSCCCSCFVAGKNHHRIKTGSLEGYESCNNACMAWCAGQYICGLGWIVQLMYREKLRERQHLEGDTLSSICASCCCPCCELMQTSKELDYIEVNQDPNQDPSKMGYQSPSGMVAAPQDEHLNQNHHQQQSQQYVSTEMEKEQYAAQHQEQQPPTIMVNGVEYRNGSVVDTHDSIMALQSKASQAAPAYTQNGQAGLVMSEKSAVGHQ